MFTRDVEESIKKYGQEMPKINLLRKIGSFALQKIIDPQKESPVEDPVFITANDWKLIDENGVNETLTEGYFIMESIGDDDDSHELFIEGWDKLRELRKDDPERWEYYARAFLTSRNQNLPSLLEFNFTDASYEYSHLIRIALAEWVRSDLVGKKQIITRLGYPSDDDGRGLLNESFEFPEECNESYLYFTLMDFHCETWSRKSEEWSNRSTDPTWERLAHEIILHECPKIIHRAKMMHHHIEEVQEGRYGKFGYYAEFYSEIVWEIIFRKDLIHYPINRKYNKQLSGFLNQFFSPSDNVSNFDETDDKTRQDYLFQNDLLLPTDLNIPGRLSGFSKLPNPIANVFRQILERLPVLRNINTQCFSSGSTPFYKPRIMVLVRKCSLLTEMMQRQSKCFKQHTPFWGARKKNKFFAKSMGWSEGTPTGIGSSCWTHPQKTHRPGEILIIRTGMKTEFI